MLNALGILIAFLQTAVLAVTFLRHRRAPLRVYGWLGLIGLATAEALLFSGFRMVAIYFTPIAWTCYILLVDAAVLAITGHSLLQNHPKGFALLALLSVPLWLIFEAYNLRLQNWTYVGLPHAWPLALLGYGWSFATITPGIFETADLILAFGWFRSESSIQFSRAARRLMTLFGAICLLVPLLVPEALARRLFILVWIGFVFLLDPINFGLGLPSLMGDFEKGRPARLYALLASGFVCGCFWEFWNYWAAAKWHYIFPMFQQVKIFEMPAPGFLGFLPFALECFCMYVTARWIATKLLKSSRPMVFALPGETFDERKLPEEGYCTGNLGGSSH